MQIRLLSCLAVSLVLCLTPVALPGQAARLAIRGATIVDVSDGSLRRDQTVLIDGNRIVRVGARAEITVPPDVETVDAAGAFLIPGLWDMHVHASSEDEVRTYYPLFIANGITGIRDTWGSRAVDAQAQRAVAAGELAGPPRTIVAGALIDGPARIWPNSLIALTPADGRRLVDSLHAAGAPFLKLYSSLMPETYFAIAERARALGIPFVGHVPELVGTIAASDAGQRSIEHLTGVPKGCSAEEESITREFLQSMRAAMAGDSTIRTEDVLLQRTRRTLATQDADRCRALAAHLARNETWQVPTLVTLRGYAYMRELAAKGDPRLRYVSPELLPFWNPTTNRFRSRTSDDAWSTEQAAFRRALELVPLLAAAGVPFLAGSDTPNPWAFPGFGLHDELELLVQAGLTPLQALQTATLNPARFLARHDELGTVAPGKLADLVLLDANPLENIANTRSIRAVIANGRLYRRAQLDALLESVAAVHAAGGKAR